MPDGERGELVITCITKNCLPLIRYRTRDIACLERAICQSGRTHPRIGRLAGRTDDMLIIRGVNVFPSQIEEALLRVDETAPHYQIRVSRPTTLDQVQVRVELRPECYSEDADWIGDVGRKIAREIQVVAGIRSGVEILPPRTLERFTGKARRVLDLRTTANPPAG